MSNEPALLAHERSISRSPSNLVGIKNRVYMKAKDALLPTKIITQNPILAKRDWFWHDVSKTSCTALVDA